MKSKAKNTKRNPAETRQKLVDATVRLILLQGFPKTTVDEICAEAKVTKGSFFHHFDSKDAVGLAAADWWGKFGTELYSAAWGDAGMDPLEQLHKFFDIMSGFTLDPEDPCTCVVGILSQEMSLVHPAFREKCEGHFRDWTGHAVRLLTAVRAKYPPVIDFDVERVAWYLNSLWQGSMLVAKTRQNKQMIRDNLQMAREWVDSFFGILATSPAVMSA